LRQALFWVVRAFYLKARATQR